MHFLLSLLSAIALLAFGVNVTKSTVLRACGASLGQILNSSLNSRFKAILVGLGTTMLVQSSTATSLLVSSFLKKGILTLGTALVIMLGADLGTAVMTRILTYDLSLLCPFLLTVGTFVYLSSSQRPRIKNCGGILLGLGLILLALSLIVTATKPVLNSDLTAMLLESLAGEITFSLLLGLFLAIICYSSLAAVLLTSLLSGSGSIVPECALSVVIGANLGSCVLEILGALRQGTTAKRVMLGNTIFKTVIAIISVPLLPMIVALQGKILPLHDFVIWFHVVFNACVCFLMWPLVDRVAKLLYILLPEQVIISNPDSPKHLEKDAYVDSNLALANATRELMRLGDFLAQMFKNLQQTIAMHKPNDPDNHVLKPRIRTIAGEVSEYLSGINCDSAIQRKKERSCLLASVDISECAQLINVIDKRCRFINKNFMTIVDNNDRNQLSLITQKAATTVELALNAFFDWGKESRARYFESKKELSLVLSKYNQSRFNHRVLDEGQDLRYNMTMLEILEHFRQIGGMFDPLFTKRSKDKQELDSDDN